MLSNGNFLVVFEDSSNTITPSTGRDIIGVIYGPEGNFIRQAFQVNVSSASENNAIRKIAAADDGGFYMAFISSLNSSSETITLEQYNSAGSRTQSTNVFTPDVTSINSIAANGLDV